MNRFNPNPISAKRIEGLISSIEKYSQKNNDFLSFALYGSLARGTSRENSDIDGYLLINIENPSNIVESSIEGIRRYKLARTEKEDYLKNLVMDSLNLTKDQVKHLEILPVSKELVKFEVAKALDGFSKYRNWQKQCDEYNNNPLKHEAAPVYPDLLVLPANIYSLFMLQISPTSRLFEIKDYLIKLVGDINLENKEFEKFFKRLIYNAGSLWFHEEFNIEEEFKL